MADSTMEDLKAPLLLPLNSNIINNHEYIIDISNANGEGGGPAIASDVRNPNPFAFLGPSAAELSLPRPTPIDPFRNRTPNVIAGIGLYGWVKLVVIVPVALIRLAIFGLALAVGYLATKLALEGWKDRQSPMPAWRCRIMWITRICSRCILFSFGYHWIQRIGRPAAREIAPIVVSNHVSYVEPIFFFYELFPTIVASESHDSIPFVGTIIRAMQVIYVDRFSAPSRKHAVSEIKRKASCNDFPRLLLFPEGTTTNGRALISFQLGAFIPGYPVQPVVVRYPHVHFDQSWGNISLGNLMFKMFTQFHNFMEVEYLPIIMPLESKQESALEFAERIFRYLDVEKKGSITFRQFLLGSAHVRKQPSFWNACETAFNKCISDCGPEDHISLNQLGDIIRSRMPHTDDETVHRLFHLFDVDDDGMISRDDFMMCLRRNPLLVAIFAAPVG